MTRRGPVFLAIILFALGVAAAWSPAEAAVLPLAFERLDGKAPASFVARGPGYALHAAPDAVTLALTPASPSVPVSGRRVRPAPAAGPPSVVRMRLAGADPAAHAVTEGTRGLHHYLTGRDTSAWRTHVPTYARVRFTGVYPGIDVVYYGTPRRLEYDFIVAPGADPRAITMVIEAPDGGAASLDPAGDLALATAAGELRLLAPVLYQEEHGARRSVDGRFVVRGHGPRGAVELGFEVGAYDPTRPLVIDPVLAYSTYVGGPGTDAAMGIAVDAARNVYLTGYTTATFTPAAGGGLFGPRGGRDVFVTKLDPTGAAALYTTYVGGDGTDEGMAIAVDGNGNAYVTGSTTSGNWPLVNHFQSHRGGSDAFLFKLGPDGSQLLYSTVIGGATGDDAGLGVGADAAGKAWVTGYTGSTDFPATVGDTSLGGPRDAFVTKIDTVNTAVNGGHQFSSLLGGGGSDEGQAIAVDGSGNIVVTGSTTSADFPTSAAGTVDGITTYGAFSATLGGSQDAFVTRFNAAGTVRVYSTYLGGTGTDTGYAIAVDTSNRAYVTGSTDSTDFPVSGAYQTTKSGGTDAFVTRINTLASGAASRLNTTYLGGGADDVGLGIAIDGANNAYVTGWTASAGPTAGFPTLSATQETYGGGASDAFVAKLAIATSGSGQLVWSTFLGGAGADSGQAVAVDLAANAYVAGVTASAAFPLAGGLTPAGPYGGEDAFVAKLADGRPDLTVSAFTAPASGGSGGPVSLTVTVKNQGEAAAVASALRLYFSEDLTFSPPPGGDPELGAGFAVGALAAGATADIPVNVTLPATTTGTRYLFAVADADGAVAESLENNNRFSRSILIGPDLAVSSLTVTSAGTQLTINDTTINQGVGLAGASTTRFYLSANSTFEAGTDQLLGSRGMAALDSGAFSSAPTAVSLPAGTTAGTYYIIAVADAAAAVTEANEANNLRIRSFLVGIDLSVTALTAPLASGPGLGVNVDYTVLNGGAIPSGSATLDLYLSTDTALDPLTDTFLTSVTVGGLAPGASAPGATPVTFPAGTPMGTYSIIAKIDGPGAIAETNENNNVRTRTITLGTDLVMYFLNAPSAAAAGATITISETVRNTGGAPAGVSATRVYLSPTPTLDLGTARLLASRSVGTLGAGVSDPASHSAVIPADVAPGPHHIIALADADATVAELNEGNNVLTRAITVNAAAAPDLTVSFVNATAAVVAGATFNVSNTVKNSGAAPAPASTVKIHLSTTTAATGSVLVLATRPANALAAGASHNASTSVTIPAGTAANLYYLVVEADAGGAITESSEGNNTGSKSLAVSLPDLTVSAFSTPAQGEAGGTIAVNDTVRNGGLGPSPASVTRFYLSGDPTLDASDPLIGSRAVPELAVGATSPGTATLAIPGGYSGTVYVIAKADGPEGVLESNETNNTSAKLITVVGPDLAVSVLGVPAGAGAGADITVSDTTANLGGGTAGSSITRFYLSTDAVLDGGDVLLGSRDVLGLGGGVSSAGATLVTIPGGTATGTYFLIARADAAGSVIETNEANNVTAQPFTVGPDLIVQSISVPAGIGSGVPLTINDSTRNQGGPVTVNTVTRFYLSTDTVLDAGDLALGSRTVGPLAAGVASTGSTTVTVPAVPAGSYYVLARADDGQAVAEVNEGNNVTARAILVGADLSVTALNAPATAGAGASISVSDTTSNDSAAAAPASTTRFYLSANGILDGGDTLLGARAVPALAARAKSTGTVSLTLPAGLSGTFYLIAKADGPDALGETDESNNTRSRVIELGPDLTVTAVSAPSAAAAGATITVQDTTRNAGIGSAPASTTRYYLSVDSAFDAGDTPIGSRAVPALAQGASSTGSGPAILPAGIGGDFYIIAVANADSGVDADPTNNTRARLISIGPDFIVTAVTAPATAGAGSVVTIGDSTRNTASAAAPASVIHYYLSPTSTLGPEALLIGSRNVPGLAAGATSTGSVTLTIPSTAPSGRQYVIAKADGPDDIPELSEVNNTRNRSISVGPNLTVSSFTVPGTGAVGGTISVTDAVLNDGAGTAFTFTVGFYLSIDSTLDAGDILLGSRSIASLAAGATSSATTSLGLPAVAPGRYNIIARVDSGETVSELDEADNNSAKAILIGPDLVVSVLGAASSVAAGAELVVTDTTLNQGAGLAGASTTTFYLSTDSVLDPLVDIPIGTRGVPALTGGASSAVSTTVSIPAGTAPGSYYIIANSDGDGGIAESVETNNARSRALTVTSP